MSEKPCKQNVPKARRAGVSCGFTGEAAAINMQKERGYVVIGFPPKLEGEVAISKIQTNFAGAALLSHNLLLLCKTDRQDWDDQVVVIFGAGHRACKKHPPHAGQRFFRCTLLVGSGPTAVSQEDHDADR